MLSSQGDPEAEAYASFSLTCLHAVSPPGGCGAECSAANFRCRHNEVRLACCEEDHDCVELSSGGTSLGTAGRFSPPTACGFECSLVLPAFWEACEPYMATELRDLYDAADLSSFASAAQACEDQDPVVLLDTLYEYQYVTGCVLHTAGLSHGDASHDMPTAWSSVRITVTRAHGASAVCYDDFHLIQAGEMLDWALLAPSITDSGNWGNTYPASNILDADAAQYCSAQGSFLADPADGGVTTLATVPERITLVFQTLVSFDQFEIAQNDGMTYNPMDFTVEGQAQGSSAWTTLFAVQGFDFSAAREVHTFDLAPTQGRRQLQFGGGIIPAVEDECPVSVMNERLAEVNTACCPPENPCVGVPVPDSCPIACAIAWSPLYSMCETTLERMIGDESQMAVFESFQNTCVAGVDVDELLAIARSAACGYESCQAHKLANPTASDGVYPIEDASGHSYMAFCDMTTSAGGWELVLRAASTSSVFTFDSALWTNDELLNEDVDHRFRITADTDSKFSSFIYSPVDEIRGCLKGRTPDDCKVYSADDLGGTEYTSMMQLFSTAPVRSNGLYIHAGD